MKAPQAMLPVVLLSAVLLGGCGYKAGGLYPEDVTTIDVPIWTVSKNVYRRNLEDRLTEAIKKQITLDTPYQIAGKGTADTRLTGTIERVEQRVLSTNPDNGLPWEKEVTFTVSFRWTDLRSGKERVNESNFKCSSTYIPQQPYSEDFFQGSEGAINEIARRIVERLQSDW